MNVYKERLSCATQNFFRVCQKQNPPGYFYPQVQSFSLTWISVSYGKRKCTNSFLGKDFLCVFVCVKKINKSRAGSTEQPKPVGETTDIKLLGETDHTVVLRRKEKLTVIPKRPPTCHLPDLTCIKWEGACSHPGLLALRCVMAL